MPTAGRRVADTNSRTHESAGPAAVAKPTRSCMNTRPTRPRRCGSRRRSCTAARCTRDTSNGCQCRTEGWAGHAPGSMPANGIAAGFPRWQLWFHVKHRDSIALIPSGRKYKTGVSPGPTLYCTGETLPSNGLILSASMPPETGNIKETFIRGHGNLYGLEHSLIHRSLWTTRRRRIGIRAQLRSRRFGSHPHT